MIPRSFFSYSWLWTFVFSQHFLLFIGFFFVTFMIQVQARFLKKDEIEIFKNYTRAGNSHYLFMFVIQIEECTYWNRNIWAILWNPKKYENCRNMFVKTQELSFSTPSNNVTSIIPLNSSWFLVHVLFSVVTKKCFKIH